MATDTMVDETTEMLIFYLLWLDARDRTYEEVIEVWHTSSPRLPVWEEASQRGLVTRSVSNGSEVVHLTSIGTAMLRK